MSVKTLPSMSTEASPRTIFVGFDQDEVAAYRACARSLREESKTPPRIIPLGIDPLIAEGVYTRTFHLRDGIRYDEIDGRPYATDFSFSRFLVPFLMGYSGLALYVDSDFLFRGDVNELFREFDPAYAVQVVQHLHAPTAARKMRAGVPQQLYARKNWSSCMLWNCSHRSNAGCDPELVNTATGQDLHRFCWLADQEIGVLSSDWNHLVGYTPMFDLGVGGPRAVHFTAGTPDIPGHEDDPFATEWRRYAEPQRWAGWQ